MTIGKGSRLSIAAACFSIYAYQVLKEQLESIEELRFIFTSQAFLREKTAQAKREFYIPKLNMERALYGTQFEVKLRNELTQKAIARECADWARRKASFRSNITGGTINPFIDVQSHASGSGFSYTPINGFTSADLGCEKGNSIATQTVRVPHATSRAMIESFDQIWNDTTLVQDVTDIVVDSMAAAYSENAPEFIYFLALYNIFSEFLDDISEDVLPKEATGFMDSKIWNMLYEFQKDAALAIINKLETYNGCVLADSVGLGKTFTALAVIKYYENRNRTVLVLCPKKLYDNWSTYTENYLNNPIAADRMGYTVLYHTDLSRDYGFSNGIALDRINWGNFDLIVIDESHNFRNGGELYGEDDDKRENRYLRLMNKVIRAGVKKKVLMLSATPVNNHFTDLRHQLALAYEGRPEQIDGKLGTKRPIEQIFRNAQRVFNEWSKKPDAQRNTTELLKALDFDFFEMLDRVTIARSRRHITKYYRMEEIGSFPERLKPLSLRPPLSDLANAINYKDIYELLMALNLAVYTPTDFILPSRLEKYNDSTNISRAGREKGIRRLMGINLLKRLESSVASFRLTVNRVKRLIEETVAAIDNFTNQHGSGTIEARELDASDDSAADFDDDHNTDYFSRRRGLRIELADMDHIAWRGQMAADIETLTLLQSYMAEITPAHDTKLQALMRLIEDKINTPINDTNRKVLIFSAFADTAEYLYEHVAPLVKQRFGYDSALVTGSVEGRTTIPGQRGSLSEVLTLFAPLARDKHLLMPHNPAEITVLIGTDCISEGQNLQDCDYCINYDIHWNPVRIIQRFGRIDRIGSPNSAIQLVNFWPDVDLDEYLYLKGRVETRMRISVMTASGDDDLINPGEQGDLRYRREQLERLQEEVVDIEEMQSGVSIMDLGLNEFRLDLLEHVKHRGDLERVPYGMHAVSSASHDTPPGAIFVLKNRNEGINIEHLNRLHPFYLVYVAADGSILHNHLAPKELLDRLRALCKGHTEPQAAVCRSFNRATRDGRDMRRISGLLNHAIASIVEIREEGEVESLFSPGGTTALQGGISGIDDFELICFIVVEAAP